MSWKDLEGIVGTWKEARSGKVWQTENRETDGVTDMITTREACASKNTALYVFRCTDF